MHNEPMTTAQATKYQINQQVELQVHDFKAPGQPLVWIAATVENIAECDHGLIDLTLARTDGITTVERVGKRGGNKRVRAL
jgi:hypothetical protein